MKQCKIWIVRKISLILFTVWICGCGQPPDSILQANQESLSDSPENDNPTPTPPKDDESDQQFPVSNTICYPTIQIGKKCFELDAITSKYGYLDPFSIPNNLFDPNQYRTPLFLIPLININRQKKISQHFSWTELVNFDAHQHVYISPSMVEHLEAIRAEIDSPIYINSGYRSPKYNASLSGAAKWSRHQYGDAVDIHTTSHTTEEMKDLCLKHGASFFQLYDSHIHCDWRRENLKEEIFGTNKYLSEVRRKKEHEITLQPKIVFKKKHLKYSFSVKNFYPEDEGNITTTWHYSFYMAPNSKTLSEKGSTLELDLTNGPVLISVNLGGSLEVTQIIQP